MEREEAKRRAADVIRRWNRGSEAATSYRPRDRLARGLQNMREDIAREDESQLMYLWWTSAGAFPEGA